MPTIHYSALFDLFKDRLIQFGYSKLTLSSHCRVVKKLIAFMKKHREEYYKTVVGERFIQTADDKATIRKFQTTINVINKSLLGLTEPQRNVKSLNFPLDENGQLAKAFVADIEERRLSAMSVYSYARHAYKLVIAMNANGLHFKDLTREFVVDYVGRHERGTTECSRCVRAFIRYLYEKGVIKYDYAPLLKHFKNKSHTPVISYYEPWEIEKLEASVNRSTNTGKRDYAMILLASRLGLRSSDILQLKFENLDWDKSLITLCQYKTKKRIILPMLKDVGEALIDYIINVRPKVESKNVFISVTRPYKGPI